MCMCVHVYIWKLDNTITHECRVNIALRTTLQQEGLTHDTDYLQSNQKVQFFPQENKTPSKHGILVFIICPCMRATVPCFQVLSKKTKKTNKKPHPPLALHHLLFQDHTNNVLTKVIKRNTRGVQHTKWGNWAAARTWGRKPGTLLPLLTDLENTETKSQPPQVSKIGKKNCRVVMLT